MQTIPCIVFEDAGWILFGKREMRNSSLGYFSKQAFVWVWSLKTKSLFPSTVMTKGANVKEWLREKDGKIQVVVSKSCSTYSYRHPSCYVTWRTNYGKIDSATKHLSKPSVDTKASKIWNYQIYLVMACLGYQLLVKSECDTEYATLA